MKKKLIIISVIIFTGLIALFFSKNSNKEKKYGASIVEALSDNTGNFTKADKIREFIFPDDKGPHPGFKTEWWYYTGNLNDKNKMHYGFQLTIFRRAINSKEIKRESAWGTNQIYFAHFTVSDIKNEKFYFAEKFSRGGSGLAGAKAKPYEVWIEDWSIRENGRMVNLKAKNDDVGINLNVKMLKPLVLQGEQGLSKKSAEFGNASYYFSQTRLQTNGVINIQGEKFNVDGLSWLDREWSTSALNKNQVGWDWFSLQLDDYREIMLYQLRLKNGGIDPFSSGSIIDKNGKVIRLNKNDFEITVLGHWKSPETSIVYPSAWKVNIPKYKLSLEIRPYQTNQELRTSVIYWEGAVKITGNNISGNGYVELTGYNEN